MAIAKEFKILARPTVVETCFKAYKMSLRCLDDRDSDFILCYFYTFFQNFCLGF